MTRISVLAVAMGVVAILAAGPASYGQATRPSRYHPVINPANFVGVIDNRYLPLSPGTTFIYEGTKGGVPASNEVYVTHETKVILGVTCIVVRDLAFLDGVLEEETLDWYAQDKRGNAWYFGEDARELDESGNVVSTEGSWEAGVNGALPGIVMVADPHVGVRYRQEYAPGVAEDMAKVSSVDKEASVPHGEFDDLLLTKEWTPLDPGVVEHKYYAPGVGFILGVMVKGGSELTELVDITTD